MILKIGAAVLAVILVVPVLFAHGVSGAVDAVFGDSTPSVDCALAAGTGVAGYGAEQLANAAVIVAVGKRLNIGEQGQVVAIAAAMQESTLINLDHGDRDSVGLFQQRPSQGWGSVGQIMNPAYAATQFYRHLAKVPGWQTMSVTDAAQAVQRSGFPDAYAQHETTARLIVGAATGAGCTTTTSVVVGTGNCNAGAAPNPVAVAAINYACGQRGLPYQWGGNGAELTELPNGQTQVTGGFDCSGLTKAAYGAAGIQLPRTAHTQYWATARVREADLVPGDLVFYGTPNTKIHHVGLYIGAGQMIDAPTFGRPVGVHPVRYRGDDFTGGGRVIR
ncbi:putative secreted protein [Alloactinosynnema sp. L-07]|uniref:C40 family peptidase n=1 Tax=Alloactinosynnema sp. L-07 TaxID=1653480 RepID=UPI00065EF45C|nr:C40 family peptidase [Alloactinosynnema sp. L-07]CRK57611.1 putative secreted protein [Alloactinosynnema sp. L-07]